MSKTASEIVILDPEQGRAYDMGRIRSVFKADGRETGSKYAISEWWLEPHTKGPGTHSHDEDDIFYVIEGTMSVFVNDRWVEARKGAFILVPGGTPHDFENRTDARAGVLNFSIPGGFEDDMPPIAEWFLKNPPGEAGR